MVLAVLIMGASPPALGDFLYGNSLYEACQDEGGLFSNGMCLGYIMGVSDSLKGSDRGFRGHKFCPPKNGVITDDPPPLNWSTPYDRNGRIEDGNQTTQT